MAYITLAEVQGWLGTTDAAKLTDNEINEYILDATRKVNFEINTKIIREKIEYIDAVRSNYINGDNKIYYIKKWENRNFGDTTDDGAVSTSDVTVYSVNTSSVESILTVSSIDYDDSSVTLSSAPNNVTLYITYDYTFFDVETPDRLIKLLTKYLTLAYCYMDIEQGLTGKNIKMGNISVKGIDSNSKTMRSMDRYNNYLRELNSYGTSKREPVSFVSNDPKPLNVSVLLGR